MLGAQTHQFSEQRLIKISPVDGAEDTGRPLKAFWQDEHAQWEWRDLSNKQYVYWWVDGIHFGVRLEEANQRILVIIGATAEGRKELVVLADGFRESEQSWKEVLLDLRSRGLTIHLKLALAAENR